jgi:AcrR family transcriptional regulator
MAAKQRAIALADKEIRRQALLDAFEALFVRHPERVVNVSEVAQAAGLAKGTVYLYFPSKEELLLALHERHTEHFFNRFVEHVEGRQEPDFDSILAVARKDFMQLPGCLALTSRCFGMMDRQLPVETAIAFKMRVGARVARAGAALERRYPALAPGAGATLLQHSLAIIVGLWQLIHPIERFGRAFERAELAMFMRDYDREVDSALRALWSGTLDPRPPVRARAPKGRKP